MNRVPYVYELIDTETGKYYIGSNYSERCNPGWLGTKYFTSSKLINPLFRANPNRFAKKILLIGSIEYVVKMEVVLLTKLDAKNDPNSYNGHNGDGRMNCSKFGAIGGKLGGSIGGKMRAASGDLVRMASAAGKIGGKVAGDYQYANKIGIHGLDKATIIINAGLGGKARAALGGMKEISALAGAANIKSGHIARLALKTNSVYYKCNECKVVCQIGPMKVHQSAKGHIGITLKEDK